jgi:S1-C subfamily serine protease
MPIDGRLRRESLQARFGFWGARLLVGFVLSAAVSDAAGAQSLRELYARVNPSVVVVHTEQKPLQPTLAGEDQKNGKGVGSGVVISSAGQVLTAAHVVQSARRIEVEFLDGQRWSARVVASAPFADVARDLLVARLGDSDRSEPGDPIFVIGAPYGVGHSLSVGHLSGRRTPENIFENFSALELFQVDMALFHGNSGGPVFDMEGSVIGIVSSVLAKGGVTHGPGFAVTSNVARKLMIEDKRPWMGVEALLIEGAMADAFNLPQAAGLLVQSVAKGSLGERLGLREGTVSIEVEDRLLLAGGDTILEMLGLRVRPDSSTFGEIQAELDRLEPEDVVKVKVLRQGETVELKAAILP